MTEKDVQTHKWTSWASDEDIKTFIQTHVDCNSPLFPKFAWRFTGSTENHNLNVQVTFEAADTMADKSSETKPEVQYCRVWRLSKNMSPTEIVATCWLAVQRAALHELAEQFKYRDWPVFCNHINVEHLVDIFEQKDCVFEHRQGVDLAP